MLDWVHFNQQIGRTVYLTYYVGTPPAWGLKLGSGRLCSSGQCLDVKRSASRLTSGPHVVEGNGNNHNMLLYMVVVDVVVVVLGDKSSIPPETLLR